ncbi:MAG: hypothetical protein AAF416_11660 [Pseudomonadota bacterium]
MSRKVAIDGLLSFKGRQYSVPFTLIGQNVELCGIAGAVQILKACQIVAERSRGTDARLLINQAHYDGPSDDEVIAPPSLGRMGRKVQGEHPRAIGLSEWRERSTPRSHIARSRLTICWQRRRDERAWDLHSEAGRTRKSGAEARHRPDARAAPRARLRSCC